MRATAILTVKNEGAFLLEWLAHHRACGFTDFLVLSNDCDDGTDAMLDRLAEMGWVVHLPNAGPHPQGPQWSALALAEGHPLVRGADWAMVLDVDEFVNIHAGDRSLSALVSALPLAEAIPLTWRLFGNDGVVAYEDRPVTQIFTRAARARFAWPWRAQMFKTLFRVGAGHWRKLGVHRPRGLVPGAAPRWFDGSGREVPELARGQRMFSDYTRDSYGLAQLNHYALGAMESYLVKCDRGRANREAAGFDMGYWVERNLAEVEDSSISRLDSSALRAGLMADPTLARLHRAAVDWRRARFAALMAEEPWRALFGRLLMTPPSHTLAADQAAPLLAHVLAQSRP